MYTLFFVLNAACAAVNIGLYHDHQINLVLGVCNVFVALWCLAADSSR